MTITDWYRDRYRKTYPDAMAMNLRLPEELASALRNLAEQTGRSQQDLTREALEEYIRDYPLRAYPKVVRHLITPATPVREEPSRQMRELLETHDVDALLASLEWARQDRL